MNEVLEQIIGYARGIWRYRWVVFGVAWPVCLIGWLVVSQLPDKYGASARVFVDTDSLLRPLLRGLAIEQDTRGQVEMMTKTLFSRPNLEKIARMTDMDLSAKSETQMDDVVDHLKDHMGLVGGRGDNLYSITYADPNPKLAKQVVQSVLTVLVENTLGDKRKDSDSAQQFIEQQIKEYEGKLLEGENKITEFRRKYLGMMPGDGKNHYDQLQAAAGEQRNVELLLKEAEKRRDELRRQLEDEEPTSIPLPSGPALSSFSSSYDSRIQGLQARLDELQLRYTESHPDVVATKKTLAEVEKKKADELAQAKKAAKSAEGSGGPQTEKSHVYQQLKLALGEAEANVASLKVRVKEFQNRSDGLRKLVNTMPQVEAELAGLNRDYEVNKQNYNQLITRRESAKMGESAEQTGDNVKFRVVDPPFVAAEPVSPNRPILVSIVFVLAVAAGIAVPLFLSLIRPTFDSAATLKTMIGRPVLGSVSMVITDRQKVRRKIEVLSFGAVGVLLVAVFSGVLVATIMNVHVPRFF